MHQISGCGPSNVMVLDWKCGRLPGSPPPEYCFIEGVKSKRILQILMSITNASIINVGTDFIIHLMHASLENGTNPTRSFTATPEFCSPERKLHLALESLAGPYPAYSSPRQGIVFPVQHPPQRRYLPELNFETAANQQALLRDPAHTFPTWQVVLV